MRALPLVLAALLLPAASAQDWQQRKEEASRYFEEALRGPPPGQVPPSAGETEPPGVDALRRAIVELFEAYEREDVAGFLALVAPSFTARDETGNDYRYADLPRALSDDFEVLERIRFAVNLGDTVLQADGRRAEVVARWSRRAWIQTGGQEWILLDQRTVFRFEAGGEGFELVRSYGDAIFGLADRQGRVRIAEGEIDGERVTEPRFADRFAGLPAPEAPPAPEPPTPSTVIAGSVSVTQSIFDFDRQNLGSGCTAISGPDVDFRCGMIGQVQPNAPATLLEITGTFAGLDAIDTLPAGPYSGAPIGLNQSNADIGRLFAVQTTDGKFAAFEISNFVAGVGLYTIRFRYQPDGSRSLK